MISNFDEFYQAIKDSDYEMTAENLSMAESTILKVLVATADDEQIKPAHDVLSNYFGLVLPHQQLVEILQADLDLAMEVFTGGISDTCQRDILINTVTRKIGAGVWPCYGDSREYSKKFFEELPAHVEKVGGKMVT